MTAPKTYRIYHFRYDGFGGSKTGGMADYTATFKEWTDDPGIALMMCSDGKDRRIPGWAIEGWDRKHYEEQDMTVAKQTVEKMMIHVSLPSSSK